MPSTLNVYLSGSVKKGADDERGSDHFWTPADELIVSAAFSKPVRLLNPSHSPISRADVDINFGCDMFLVSRAQGVLVDLRRSKGIGVGAEMMFARQLGVPVVGWLGEQSHYQRDRLNDVQGENLVSWVHPFVSGLCTAYNARLGVAAGLLAEAILHSDKNASQQVPEPIGAYIARFIRHYPEFAAGVERAR